MSDDEPVMVPCSECHGTGEFGCVDGCHTTECSLCEGKGEIWEGDVPV